jgi:hypothetical protein
MEIYQHMDIQDLQFKELRTCLDSGYWAGFVEESDELTVARQSLMMKTLYICFTNSGNETWHCKLLQSK